MGLLDSGDLAVTERKKNVLYSGLALVLIGNSAW